MVVAWSGSFALECGILEARFLTRVESRKALCPTFMEGICRNRTVVCPSQWDWWSPLLSRWARIGCPNILTKICGWGSGSKEINLNGKLCTLR